MRVVLFCFVFFKALNSDREEQDFGLDFVTVCGTSIPGPQSSYK